MLDHASAAHISLAWWQQNEIHAAVVVIANIDLFWINRHSNQKTAPEALARCPLTVSSVANVLTDQDS